MNFRLLLFAIVILGLLSTCKKEDSNSVTSARLSLLQEIWTSRTTGLYLPNGQPSSIQVQHLPNTTYIFKLDNNFYISNPQNSTSYRPYKLLDDDSTLIFTNLFPVNNNVYDTNYITSLTEQELIFHGLNKTYSSPLISWDTLRR